MSFFFFFLADGRASHQYSIPNDPWYQLLDTFFEPPLEYPYPGHPCTGHEILLDNLLPSNDTPRRSPAASIDLPAEIVPGSTSSLGDPGLFSPFHGIDQLNLRLESAQSNVSDDMVEAPFLGEAHVNTEARSTTSSAIRSVPVGKLDEADDKITVADIDRLLGNHDRVCLCLNCLGDIPGIPHLRDSAKFRNRFPALQQISCRIEGCTWIQRVDQWYFFSDLWDTQSHEQTHFREETRDQDGKLVYTCKDGRCRIRTKRRDDVKRHYATVHCKNPQRFPCHVIGCPFGGENGFTRKDKLTSHMKSTHKGLPHSGKRLQAIKPNTGVSNSGVHKAGSQA